MSCPFEKSDNYGDPSLGKLKATFAQIAGAIP